jgi:outer membrane protein assembly factor BamA
MIKQAARIAALLLLCVLPALAQKKAPPAPRKTSAPAIRFQGAPQYTQEELLAAAGLNSGARLSASEVKAHAKQLNDTGLFAMVKFSSDSKGLLFSLTPSSQLFPMHLDNLPLQIRPAQVQPAQPGKELDPMIHARFPLYHGLLPANGSMLEGIRQMFEEMLADEGIKATVKAALTSGLGPQKITAIDFTITSPPVRIGPIQLSGVSPAMQASANTLIAGQTGNAFDTENTAIGLEHAFQDLYQDQGYAAVEVSVTQIDPPNISDSAVAIPFAVAVKEGGIYKLGAITYPADALVPRSEVEKVLSKYQAGSGRPLDLFLLAVRDAYHAHGYLDCSVVSHAAFNEATHIANYSLEIVPGASYQMGTVHFDGAPDAMAAKLTRLWKMAPGQPFDESYVSTFAARAQKQDHSLAKWMQTVITSFDVKPDPATHQVICIFHFAKAQNAH